MYSAGVTSATSVSRPVDGALILTDQREAFCALVASGISYRKAALRCGWTEDYGWTLMQETALADRVRELSLDPVERVRAGIEGDLIIMRRRVAEGDVDSEERATLDLRLKLLMAHAKLRGWIVDRKQVDKRSVDISLVSAEDLQSHLGEALDALEPGTRRAIEERVSAVKARKSRARITVESVTTDIQ